MRRAVLITALLALPSAAADLGVELDALKHNGLFHLAVVRLANAGASPYARAVVDCAFLKAGKAQAVGQATTYAIPARDTVFLEVLGPASKPDAIDEARCRLVDTRK
jgi:hypothetical protein